MKIKHKVTRSIEKDLEDLDETDQAIVRLSKRLEAQEHRIVQLKRDGVETETAEQLRSNMRDSLKDLIAHRALIMQALASRADRAIRDPISLVPPQKKHHGMMKTF